MKVEVPGKGEVMARARERRDRVQLYDRIERDDDSSDLLRDVILEGGQEEVHLDLSWPRLAGAEVVRTRATGDQRGRIELTAVASTFPVERGGRAVGDAFDMTFAEDTTLQQLTLHGLVLHVAGGTHYQLAGMSSLTSPYDEDDPPADRTRTVVVLSGGPDAGNLLPVRSFPGLGAPNELYGSPLSGAAPEGTTGAVRLDVGGVRARVFRLQVCRGAEVDRVGGPLDLVPISFGVDQVTGTVQGSVRAVKVHAGPPGPPDPVLLWDHPPALPADRVQEVNVANAARALLEKELVTSAEGDLVLPLRLTATGPGRLRVRYRPPPVELVRRPLERPLRIHLDGRPRPVLLSAVVGQRPDRALARLSGAFDRVRRVAASDAEVRPSGACGLVLAGDVQVARRFPVAALDRVPLARVALHGMAEKGELVVEVRKDAGGPGERVGAPGTVALTTHGEPGWWAVDLPGVAPEALGGEHFWVLARVSRGRFHWSALGGGTAWRSGDGGGTWQAQSVGADRPLLRLLVDDPGGPAPVSVYADSGTRAVEDLLDGFRAARFDRTGSLPGALAALLQAEAPDRPTRIWVDSARTLDLELADLSLHYEVGPRSAAAEFQASLLYMVMLGGSA